MKLWGQKESIKLIPISQSTPKALQLLLQGHNEGKWQLKIRGTNYWNERAMWDVLVKGQITRLNYCIPYANTPYLVNEQRFCVNSYTGTDDPLEMSLMFAMHIHSNEIYFLRHSTYFGFATLRDLYINWFKHPILSLLFWSFATYSFVVLATVISQHL